MKVLSPSSFTVIDATKTPKLNVSWSGGKGSGFLRYRIGNEDRWRYGESITKDQVDVSPVEINIKDLPDSSELQLGIFSATDDSNFHLVSSITVKVTN